MKESACKAFNTAQHRRSLTSGRVNALNGLGSLAPHSKGARGHSPAWAGNGSRNGGSLTKWFLVPTAGCLVL